jgi:pimeloyl-ACP methyl ester carboxylesterase
MPLKEQLAKYVPRLVGAWLNTSAVVAPRYAGNKAVDIFCTPRKGKIRPKDEAALETFTKETLMCNGLPVQCYRKGDGAFKILFVHGWESNAARWRPLMDMFEQAGPCMLLALDAPAHGASGAAQFNSLLYGDFIETACMHYQPQLIIGHSIGAASTVYYLTHLRAQPLQQLILMGCPCEFTDIVADYIQLVKMSRRTQKIMMRTFEERFNMKPHYYSIKNFAAKLQVPGWVIHDRQDDVIPFHNAEAITSNWHGSQLMATEGLGHSLNNTHLLQQVAAVAVR